MRIANHQLAVEIATLGAELQSIETPDGGQWLWHGDPRWWNGRAPLLFPVVGKSPDGHVSIEGKSYPMQPHGFARHSEFDIVAGEADRATLALHATAGTRESFPFDFVLSTTYALEDNCLVTMVEVRNLDRRDMPFGFGFHPAFSWPLPGGAGKRHVLRLRSAEEPEFLQLDANGLILPDRHASPFVKGELTLQPSLFANDALMFPLGVGSGITLEAEGGASVELTWANLPNFAIWQRRDAPFICLEPWHGMSARIGAGEAMTDRPGTVVLEPGATAAFELRARFNRAG